MVRFCICGKPVPRRKKKGGQEKQYCCNACRQRAYRKRNEIRFLVEKQIRKSHQYPIGEVELDLQYEIERLREENGHLRLELMMLREFEVKAQEREIDDMDKKLHDAIRHSDYLQSLLAEKDAEIVRLNVLLESMAKKKRS